MFSYDLANNLKTIINELKFIDILELFNNEILVLDKPTTNYPSGLEKRTINSLIQLQTKTYMIANNESYKEIMEKFSFFEFINDQKITEMIEDIHAIRYPENIFTNRYMYLKFLKFVFFLSNTIKVSNILNEILVAEKKISLNENEEETKIIIADTHNGVLVNEFIQVFIHLDIIYKNLSKLFNLSDNSFRIEYCDSGSDLSFSLIGAGDTIRAINEAIQIFQNRKYASYKNKMEAIQIHLSTKKIINEDSSLTLGEKTKLLGIIEKEFNELFKYNIYDSTYSEKVKLLMVKEVKELPEAKAKEDDTEEGNSEESNKDN